MFGFSKIALVNMALTSSLYAETTTLNCQLPEARGIPVVQIKLENNRVTETREHLRSSITGTITTGPKLKRFGVDNSGVFQFHLGSSYTVDYSLIVDTTKKPVEVLATSYDRDDASEHADTLNCY